MITQLTAKNFQSIEDATLDLAPVSLVVGKNYSGKSALAIRALYALATNQTGDDFIRQGEKSACVSVTLDDGVAITWTKAKGKSGEYTLGDRTFTKTAGQVPEEIAEALGIRPIVIDDTLSIMPQIQRQWDAPFLIGETGSRQARLLGKLTKVDVIVSAQMSTRKKRDRHAKDRDAAEEEHIRLTEQREALPPIEDLRADLSLIDSSIQRAETIESGVETVRALAAELRRVQRITAIELSPVRGKIALVQVLITRMEDGNRVKALQIKLVQAQRVQGIELTPIREQITQAQALLERVTLARGLLSSLTGARSSLEGAEAGIKRSSDGVTAARERHTAECTKMGICKTCPFVEVVT